MVVTRCDRRRERQASSPQNTSIGLHRQSGGSQSPPDDVPTSMWGKSYNRCRSRPIRRKISRGTLHYGDPARGEAGPASASGTCSAPPSSRRSSSGSASTDSTSSRDSKRGNDDDLQRLPRTTAPPQAPPLKSHPSSPVRVMINIRNRRTGVVVAALFVVAALIYGFWPEAESVEVAVVERGPLSVVVEEEARTRVAERYEITAPVSGYLRRVTVEEGDTVSAGDVLCVLDPQRAAPLDPRHRAEAEAIRSSAGFDASSQRASRRCPPSASRSSASE